MRCGRCGAQFDAITTLDSTVGPVTVSGVQEPPAEDTVPNLSLERGLAFDFGPKSRGRSSWVWWLLSALMLLILAAQAAYRSRGEMSVLLPKARPLTERACAALGCEVPLPRRVELLSIESSDLQAAASHSSIMVLTATIRNRAGFNQEFPELELTLTNARDETLARRVLQPSDYATKGSRLDAGFAPASDLQIRVYIEAPDLSPTGYRLYLFYS